MLRITSIVIFSLFSPVVALAAPVYLDCKFPNKKEDIKFSVKLDESSGKITHTWSDGAAFNSDGFFAPNSITYKDVVIAEDIKINMQYEINRKTLVVKRKSIIEALNPDYASLIPPSNNEEEKGICEVLDVSDRKI